MPDIIFELLVSIIYVIWIICCYRRLELEKESIRARIIVSVLIILVSAWFFYALFID